MSGSDKAAHSPIGASSAYRWMACPGSVQACKQFPSTQSKYAAEGTIAHRVAEYYLRNHKAPNGEYVGEREEEGDFVFVVNEDMEHYVEVYYDIVSYHLASTGTPWSALQVEAEISLPHIHPDAWGTCDAMFSDLRTLHVFDLKYGRGLEVESQDNPQLKYYALGAYYSLDEFHRNEIEEVVVHIVQPRVQNPHKMTTYKISELLEFETQLAAAIQKTELPPDQLTFAAGSHCKFCQAKVGCSEYRSNLNEKTNGMFEKMVGGAKPAVQEVEVSTLVSLHEMKEDIVSYLNAVSDYLLMLARSGKPPEGYRLGQHLPRVNRTWVDENDAMTTLSELGVDNITTVKLKSPSQIEKLLSKNKVLLEKVKNLWHKPPAVPVDVLVKEDSEKPPIETIDRNTLFSQYKDV